MATLVGAYASPGSTSATTIATPSFSATTGNPLIAVVRWEQAVRTPTLSDTAGNTYTRLTIASSGASNVVYSVVFYCLNPTGHASNVVTANFGSATSYTNMEVTQWAGPLMYVDERTAGTSGTSITAASMTSTVSGIAVAAGGTYNNNTTSTGTGGFTATQIVQSGSGTYLHRLHKIIAGAETVTAGATYPNSTGLSLAVALFADGTLATIEQEGYRFYADGTESGATALVAQDTAVTQPLNTNTILRVLLNSPDDPSSRPYRLDYKKSTDSTYIPVPVGAATIPVYVNAGDPVSGIANITVDWPVHQPGDIGLLLIESTGGQPAALATAAGFAAVDNSPSVNGATTAGTRLTAYWCRATTSSQASPVVTDPGNHAYGQILVFRGCVETGDPWDVTAASQTAVGTSTSAPSVTTTVANCLIVNAIARDNDSAAAAFSNWSNANLSGLTEVVDLGTIEGNGGGIGVACGLKVSAGATGATTATVTSSINAALTIALKPAALPPIFVSPSANVAAGGVNTTARLTPPSGKTTSNFTAGRLADDENPLDAVDIASNGYTELAWVLQAQSPAANADVYQFRVTISGSALDSYSVTPSWTIGTPGTISESVASSAGAATAQAVGRAEKPAVASSAGVATAAAVGTSTSPSTGPTVVSYVAAGQQSGAAPAITFPTVAAGDLLVVYAHHYEDQGGGRTGLPTGVTGGNGSTWTLIDSLTPGVNPFGLLSGMTLYACIAANAGSTTLTYTMSGFTSGAFLIGVRVQGHNLTYAGPSKLAFSGSALTSYPTGATTAPATQPTLAISFFQMNGGNGKTFTQPTGYTNVFAPTYDGGGDYVLGAATKAKTDTTTENPAWTLDTASSGSFATTGVFLIYAPITTGVGSSAGSATASATGTAVKPTQAASAGVATASATGTFTAVRSSEATSAGVGAAVATGRAEKPAQATSAGVGAANATGTFTAVRSSVASSAGVGAATATGRADKPAQATSAGSATVSATGSFTAVFTGVATSAGSAAASATARAEKPAVASSAGAGVANATGAFTAVRSAQGTSEGAATAAATSNTAIVSSAVGSAAGVGAASGTTAIIRWGVGSSAGSALVAASGTGVKPASGASAGTATATGATAVGIASTGSSAGAGAANGAGGYIRAVVGSAAGAAGPNTAVGRGTAASVGSSLGAGTANGVGPGVTVVSSTATSAGAAQAQATAAPLGIASGQSSGSATVSGTGRALKPAAGSSAGNGTATGVSAFTAIRSSLATSAGSATVSATGRGGGAAVGTSAGVAFAPAVSNNIGDFLSQGSAAGSATVQATGRADRRSTATSAGVGAASATGAAIRAAVGAPGAGVATASGTGTGVRGGVGSSTGSGTVQATGRSTSASVGTAQGQATVSAIQAGTASGFGTSAGSATAAATARSETRSSGQSAGVATATATARGQSVGAGSAAGATTVIAYSEGQASGAATSVGSSATQAYSDSQAITSGTAAGAGSASATGRADKPTRATSAGVATVQAVSARIAASVGSSVGSALATGWTISGIGVTGTASGSASAQAQGVAQTIGTGSATGLATAAAVGFAVGGAIGDADGSALAVAFATSEAQAVGEAGGSSTATGAGDTERGVYCVHITYRIRRATVGAAIRTGEVSLNSRSATVTAEECVHA